MRRNVALAQGAEKFIDCLAHDSPASFHDQTHSPQRHGDTEKTNLFVTYFARMNTHQDTKRFIRVNPRKIRGNALPPCFRPSVVKALIWPSPADDVLRTRSSAGPARRGYRAALSKCRSGRESSARCASRRRFLPCEWRNCGAACADWRGVQRSTMRSRPSARLAGG